MASRMQDPESYNRIFILGAKNCTEDSLRDVFSEYGNVKDVYFVRDRRTDERKGTHWVKLKFLSARQVTTRYIAHAFMHRENSWHH